MSSFTPFVESPEAEVLTFKQRGGESLKDAWYRIRDAHHRSSKKHWATVLLRIFYVGITSWYRYILDTITGGNFLGVSALEPMNAIESLVGAPPINDTKTKITLEDIMERFDTLENNIPSMSKINEMDKKIDNNFNRVNGYIRNSTKIVKSLHSPKDHSERIIKLEETFETLGATLSSFKPKKEATTKDKGPKFIFVPNNTTK